LIPVTIQGTREILPDGTALTHVTGLKGPHAIRRRKTGGYYLADSWHNRIVFFGHGRKDAWNLGHVADWLQDAVEVGRDTWLVADAGHHRIVRLNRGTGRVEKEWRFSPEWRIYQIQPTSD
jgi:hypothetical protein